MTKHVRTKKLPVADIVIDKRWRTPTAKQIAMLRDSLRENGLLAPIGVHLANEGNGQNRKTWVLVYGASRLVAAKEEGWSKIEARIHEGSEVTLEMAELAENLHRGELTKLERDRQIARYVELCGSKEIAQGPRKNRERLPGRRLEGGSAGPRYCRIDRQGRHGGGQYHRAGCRSRHRAGPCWQPDRVSRRRRRADFKGADSQGSRNCRQQS